MDCEFQIQVDIQRSDIEDMSSEMFRLIYLVPAFKQALKQLDEGNTAVISIKVLP